MDSATITTIATIISALGASGITAGLIKLIEYKIKKRDKSKEEKSDMFLKQKFDEFSKPINTKLDMIINKIDAVNQKLEVNNEATLADLRANMKTQLDLYQANNYASPNDKASWLELYQKYVAMGGNSLKLFVDAWKKEIEELPENKKKSTLELYMKHKGGK